MKEELSALGLAEAVRRGWGKGPVERIANVFFGFVFVLGGMFSVALVAIGLFDADEWTPWVVAAFVACLLLSFVPFFLGIRHAMLREMLVENEPPPPPPRSPELAAQMASVCSACGAPVLFTVVAPSAICAHCRSTVLPTDEVKARLTALTRFLTDLETARHLRAHARSMGLSAFGDGLGWFVGRMGLLFPIVGVYVVLFVMCELIAGDWPDYANVLAVVPLAISVPFGVVLFGLTLVVERWLRRRSRVFSALSELARRFHGQVSARGTRAAFDWLDAHWSADTPEGALVTHNSDQGKSVDRTVASFHYRGHPVLVMLARAPHVNRVDLFVSAHDRERGRPPRIPELDELARAGWEPSTNLAGLHLHVKSSDPQHCQPDLIEWLLARGCTLLETK
jgi:hypothetical protein